ncbi:MAG: TonB-dependent receptor, partial [Sinobacteraceae bacterium]|nr:TonB-dependent receptor [Nevskiaceae bacterium]
FPPASGYYDPNENFNSDGNDRQFGVSLKITHDFDWSRLVSISAYRDTRADYLLDEDSGPLPIVNVQIATPETTFTQELHLISPSGAGLSWIAGIFYLNDKAGFDPIRFTGLGFAPLPFVYAYGIQTTQSYAVFAQATGTILSDTHLTAGARYTRDDRTERAGAVFGGGAQVPAPNSPQSKSWSSPTWRLVLDHSFSPDIMAYLGDSRGFKSGLFNPVVLPGAPIDEPVNPETLDAYTVSVKSEYLQHRLRVNIEGFYYDYKNIQVEQILSAVSHITNAAKATIKGVDLDISAVPADGLTLTASLEAMEGKYDSFPDGTSYVYNPITGGNCTFAVAVPPAPVPCGGVTPPGYNAANGSWDLKGNHTIQTPPFSVSLIGQYEIPTPIGRFDLNLAWTHSGNYYASADNGKGQIPPSSSQNDLQKLIDVLNGSLGWTASNRDLEIRLWAKNMTDVRYWSYADEISFATFYSPAPPRSYGVTITKRFE